VAGLVVSMALACGSNGGASGGGSDSTGTSEGAVTAFGSVFVNGVEWSLSDATVELDDAAGTEGDLRLGMVVRVDGVPDEGGLTGAAESVVFDDTVEGPVERDPVDVIPGVEKSFHVLGQEVRMRAEATVFDGGVSFDGLSSDDVVEVSGFVCDRGLIHATRIEGRGAFPANDVVELRGRVSNHVANADGTGIFDLGPIVVRYTAATPFDGVTRAALVDTDLVEVGGTLRPSGTEVDAEVVELEEEGLGSGDLDRVEVVGFLVGCPASPDFCVNGIPVVTSSADLEPMGFVPAIGRFVHVIGPLDGGLLVADRIESVVESAGEVRIDGGVTSIDPAARTLDLLGITVSADGGTGLEDVSSAHDASFRFAEIQPGDFVSVRGFDTGTARVRAVKIQRRDASVGVDSVLLQGPVTALDTLAPSLSILGQPIPLDAGTLYLDLDANPQTEEAFFRNPGEVALGDVVRAIDADASDLGALLQADEVGLEDD
jgi:hypothetical protein